MSLIRKPTKLSLERRGELTLRPADYVTQGGEGAIYAKQDLIIKLHLDAAAFAKHGMDEKVRLLMRSLQHPSIVAPKGLVFSEKQPIGYYMDRVRGEAYPRLFTNDFRTQAGFANEGVKVLAEKMREVVRYAHDRQTLLVDANELNWLATLTDPADPVPYVIDVDSWSIGRFKSSVIMPSIRDWQGAGFCELSDWFAWGIVTFLLFTGIHPYKGKLPGYKPGELTRRMQENASVFLPEVRLNRAVRDFSCIPGPLLSWYEETFQNGHRSEPPSPLQDGPTPATAARIMRTVTTGSGNLVFEKLFEQANDPVTSVWPCSVVRTESGALYEALSGRKLGRSAANRLAVTAHPDGWLLAEYSDGNWTFRFLSRAGRSTDLPLSLQVETVVRSGDRLFAATPTELVALSLRCLGKPILTADKRWDVQGKATTWLHGLGVMDVLGTSYLVVPFGESSVAFVKAPELTDHTVVGGVAGTRFAEVMTVNDEGAYESLGFAFDEKWQHYTLHRRPCDGPEQNTVVLPKGVTATIVEDGELIVSVPYKGEQKVVTDTDIATTMALAHVGNRVVYRHDGALWSLRMQ